MLYLLAYLHKCNENVSALKSSTTEQKMFFCVNVLLLGMLKEKLPLSLIYFLLNTLALFVDELFSFRKVNFDFLQYS